MAVVERGTKTFKEKEYEYGNSISSAIVKECDELRKEIVALLNRRK